MKRVMLGADGSPTHAFILNLDAETITTVDYQGRRYMSGTLQEFVQMTTDMMKMAQDALGQMGDVMARMRESMKNMPPEQRQMMEESFDVIVRLMHGEVVSKKTDWFDITDAQLQLRPYTQPTMELAVAAARSPSGSVLAGKYGVGMLSIGGTAPAQMERHTANWNLYEETARANGHTPHRKDWRVVGFFHIAETREQARQNMRFGVQAFANYFRDVATFPIIPPDVADPIEWLIETGTACIGTPDDAVAYVERLMQGSGGFGVLCELAQNWADWEQTKRHYELMARFVHPHFQQSRDLLRGSYDYAVGHRADFVGRASAAIQKAIDQHAARQGKKEAAE